MNNNTRNTSSSNDSSETSYFGRFTSYLSNVASSIGQTTRSYYDSVRSRLFGSQEPEPERQPDVEEYVNRRNRGVIEEERQNRLNDIGRRISRQRRLRPRQPTNELRRPINDRQNILTTSNERVDTVVSFQDIINNARYRTQAANLLSTRFNDISNTLNTSQDPNVIYSILSLIINRYLEVGRYTTHPIYPVLQDEPLMEAAIIDTPENNDTITLSYRIHELLLQSSASVYNLFNIDILGTRYSSILINTFVRDYGYMRFDLSSYTSNAINYIRSGINTLGTVSSVTNSNHELIAVNVNLIRSFRNLLLTLGEQAIYRANLNNPNIINIFNQTSLRYYGDRTWSHTIMNNPNLINYTRVDNNNDVYMDTNEAPTAVNEFSNANTIEVFRNEGETEITLAQIRRVWNSPSIRNQDLEVPEAAYITAALYRFIRALLTTNIATAAPNSFAYTTGPGLLVINEDEQYKSTSDTNTFNFNGTQFIDNRDMHIGSLYRIRTPIQGINNVNNIFNVGYLEGDFYNVINGHNGLPLDCDPIINKYLKAEVCYCFMRAIFASLDNKNDVYNKHIQDEDIYREKLNRGEVYTLNSVINEKYAKDKELTPLANKLGIKFNLNIRNIALITKTYTIVEYNKALAIYNSLTELDGNIIHAITTKCDRKEFPRVMSIINKKCEDEEISVRVRDALHVLLVCNMNKYAIITYNGRYVYYNPSDNYEDLYNMNKELINAYVSKINKKGKIRDNYNIIEFGDNNNNNAGVAHVAICCNHAFALYQDNSMRRQQLEFLIGLELYRERKHVLLGQVLMMRYLRKYNVGALSRAHYTNIHYRLPGIDEIMKQRMKSHSRLATIYNKINSINELIQPGERDCDYIEGIDEYIPQEYDEVIQVTYDLETITQDDGKVVAFCISYNIYSGEPKSDKEVKLDKSMKPIFIKKRFDVGTVHFNMIKNGDITEAMYDIISKSIDTIQQLYKLHGKKHKKIQEIKELEDMPITSDYNDPELVQAINDYNEALEEKINIIKNRKSNYLISILAHNGGKFDHVISLPYIHDAFSLYRKNVIDGPDNNKDIDIHSVQLSSTKLIDLAYTIRRSKCNYCFHFRDSCNMLQMSLKKASETYIGEEIKSPFNYKYITQEMIDNNLDVTLSKDQISEFFTSEKDQKYYHNLMSEYDNYNNNNITNNCTDEQLKFYNYMNEYGYGHVYFSLYVYNRYYCVKDTKLTQEIFLTFREQSIDRECIDPILINTQASYASNLMRFKKPGNDKHNTQLPNYPRVKGRTRLLENKAIYGGQVFNLKENNEIGITRDKDRLKKYSHMILDAYIKPCDKCIQQFGEDNIDKITNYGKTYYQYNKKGAKFCDECKKNQEIMDKRYRDIYYILKEDGVLDNSVACLDAVGLYASAMILARGLPAGKCREVRVKEKCDEVKRMLIDTCGSENYLLNKPVDESHPDTLTDVELKDARLTCGVNIYRLRNKSLVPQCPIRKDGKLHWSNELGDMKQLVLDDTQLRLIIWKHKLEYEDFDIIYYMRYNDVDYSIGKFINRLFNERQVAKANGQDALQEACKLIMNSAYGQMILKIRDTGVEYCTRRAFNKIQDHRYVTGFKCIRKYRSDKVKDDRDLGFVTVNTKVAEEDRYGNTKAKSNYKHYGIGRSILSMSKAIMAVFHEGMEQYNKIHNTNEPIYYTDTDSFYIPYNCCEWLMTKSNISHLFSSGEEGDDKPGQVNCDFKGVPLINEGLHKKIGPFAIGSIFCAKKMKVCLVVSRTGINEVVTAKGIPNNQMNIDKYIDIVDHNPNTYTYTNFRVVNHEIREVTQSRTLK